MQLGALRFESLKASLYEAFCDFLLFLQENYEMLHQCGHKCFLSQPPEFVPHQ